MSVYNVIFHLLEWFIQSGYLLRKMFTYFFIQFFISCFMISFVVHSTKIHVMRAANFRIIFNTCSHITTHKIQPNVIYQVLRQGLGVSTYSRACFSKVGYLFMEILVLSIYFLSDRVLIMGRGGGGLLKEWALNRNIILVYVQFEQNMLKGF